MANNFALISVRLSSVTFIVIPSQLWSLHVQLFKSAVYNQLFKPAVQISCLYQMVKSAVQISCFYQLFKSAVQIRCSNQLFKSAIQISFLYHMFKSAVYIRCSNQLFKSAVSIRCSNLELLHEKVDELLVVQQAVPVPIHHPCNQKIIQQIISQHYFKIPLLEELQKTIRFANSSRRLRKLPKLSEWRCELSAVQLTDHIEGLQYTQSTRVSVPSSELGLPTPSPRKRVCLPPWTQRGVATFSCG